MCGILALILAAAALVGCDNRQTVTNPLREQGPGQITSAEKKLIANMTIRVGGDANYPPFVFAGPDGKPQGLSVDFFEETAKRLGVKYEYTFIGQRAEMLKKLEAKEIDMTLASRTATSRPYLIVTQPYEYSRGALLVNKNFPPAEVQTVGAGRGYASVTWLKANKPQYKVIEVEDDEDCINRLVKKELHSCMMGREIAFYLTDKMKLDIGRFDMLPIEYSYFLSFGVHAENIELADILIKGLVAIPQQRQHEILKKWLKEPFL